MSTAAAELFDPAPAGDPATPDPLSRPTSPLRRAGRRVAAITARHPVLVVFLVAFLARFVVSAAIAVFNEGRLFEDDAGYVQLARQAAEGRRESWGEFQHHVWSNNRSFLFPLTAVFWVVGPVAFAGQLVVALAGAATAAAVTRLGMEGLRRPLAVAVGLTVALLPSQVLFSSVTLKDGFVWMTLAAIALVVARAGDGDARRQLVLVLLLALLLVVMANLRDHTLVVAAWAAAAAVWAGRPRLRVARGIAALALAVAVPWAAGVGPGGLSLVRSGGAQLEEQRAAGASGATTAIVATTTTTVVRPSAVGPGDGPPYDGRSGEGRLQEGEPGAPDATAASGAPLPTAEEELGRNLSYLPKGLSVMLLWPYPWQATDNSNVEFARAESLVWYPLLALALLGLTGLWRHRRMAAFPLLVGSGTAVMWGLVEGNFGTAFRHRGEFAWVVILLAGLGAEVALRPLARRLGVRAWR